MIACVLPGAEREAKGPIWGKGEGQTDGWVLWGLGAGAGGSGAHHSCRQKAWSHSVHTGCSG